MDLVAAALGSDLNLGAAEAAVFRVIAIGDNFHVLNRLFRWRNDCSSAPDCADGADSVDRDAVVLILPTIGQSLRSVLGRENSFLASGCAGSLRAGKLRTATAIPCAPLPNTPGASWTNWKTSRPNDGMC